MNTAVLKESVAADCSRKKKQSAKPDEVRVQLILSSKSVDRLDKLKESLDAASRAEVLRMSLGLLEKVMSEIDENRKIIVIDKSGNQKELVPLV